MATSKQSDENAIISKRLMLVRKNAHKTREELAHELNMSVNTLRNYENGSRSPSFMFVMLIAVRFGVSVDYIMGMTDNVNGNVPEFASDKLTESEKKLLKRFRSLNQDGKNRLLEYEDDLFSCGKYSDPNNS